MIDLQNKKSTPTTWKYALAVIILIFIIGGTVLVCLWNKKEEVVIVPVNSPTPTLSVFPSPTPITTPIITPATITYTAFSSPKANFTFEYPSNWAYEEKIDPNDAKSTDWDFYIDSNHKTEIPIFAVISPMSEWVDLCSGKASNPPNATAIVNTYKTNDPKTYVTYEQCGDINAGIGTGYIYWQKGKRLSGIDDIIDIHQLNLIVFYFNPDFPERNNIAKYIAQSVKIK